MKQFLVLLLISLLNGVEGFATNSLTHDRALAPLSRGRETSLFMVQASPPRESASSSNNKPNNNNNNNNNRNQEFRRTNNKSPRIRQLRTRDKGRTSLEETGNAKWERAVKIENQMVLALEALQGTIAMESSASNSNSRPNTGIAGLLFPSIRECNAALAAFGDSGELLRALRLFMKMRKAASLAQSLLKSKGFAWPVPSPTLVTYSTIMSRANRMGKPKVALRMWMLMRKSPEFMGDVGGGVESQTTATSASTNGGMPQPNTIVPDIKAANILMNSFAKLADIASAQDLLNQMIHGNGTDIPTLLEANLVTFNTLMDACHKAGDLDAALNVMRQIEDAGLTPDAWSYTSLIATVARNPSKASGANDPSLAFTFLTEMKERHNIQPNGMTYSALIDACGRCRRYDLALQGLRIMLRQKAMEQRALTKQQPAEKGGATSKEKASKRNDNNGSKYKGKPENYSLSNEVGAWTAAINALGKEGRTHAAVKLFFAMPNFGVKPNTVTCGCLTDSLLKHGRTAETLKVLRYMEQNAISPSEVMYTSLMSRAGILARQEINTGSRKETITAPVQGGDEEKRSEKQKAFAAHAQSCTAIEVYTLLMKSLTEDRMGGSPDIGTSGSSEATNKDSRKAHSLMKVFLVFQEMKEAGAQADLACYNSLLRACARAGDISRAQSVLRQMEEDALEPNDTTWRQLIRAAGHSQRYDIVLSTWRMAVGYSYDIKSHLGSFDSQIRSSYWIPSIATFSSMISALLRSAADQNLPFSESRRLYQCIVVMYQRVLSGNKDEKFGMHRIDKAELIKDARAMLVILQAIVALEQLNNQADETSTPQKSQLQQLATQILALESVHNITQKQRLSRSAFRSVCVAQSWANDFRPIDSAAQYQNFP